MTKDRLEELNALGEEMVAVLEQLSKDLAVCYELGAINDNHDFWRRTYVRTLFACIEGYCFQYKRATLVMAEISAFTGVQFSYAEQMLMAEKIYELNNKGEITEKKAKLRTAENFLFSLRMVTKGCGAEMVIDKSAKEWQDFQVALNIRDRITHPKTAVDVMISIEEVQTVVRAANWFSNLTQQIGAMLLEFGERIENLSSKFVKVNIHDLSRVCLNFRKSC